MRIALDAMGGDHAPDVTVKGAVMALDEDPSLEVVVVGDEEAIGALLDGSGRGPVSGLEVRHAPDMVKPDENPLAALRRKGKTSIDIAARMVRAGEAEALVSCGNTGATVAAAMFNIKLLEGVRRAGIATFLPSLKGRTTLIDVGANLRCQPEHLFQYGVMASIYVKYILSVEDPTIGLLNIGEEDAKGNDLVKRTWELFTGAEVNFVGNLEGQDIFRHQADVVVCEGFVGNAALKAAEGLAEVIMVLLGKEFPERVGMGENEREILLKGLEYLRQRTDYREYGGAPLMGVRRPCIIGHGRSDSHAVRNAIRAAKRCTELGINDHILEELGRLSPGKR